MRARLLGAALAILSSGCGPSDPGGEPDGGPVPMQDGGPARVDLGTGQSNFEQIGATIELVAGPQGGWHLFVTARLYGMDVEGMRISYRTERDGVVISLPVELVLTRSRLLALGDHYLRAGDFVVFDITMPSDVVGDTVTVTVTADPVDGDPVTDSKTAMVVDEEP